MSESLRLSLRLVALSFFAVVIQVAGVSQVSVFGVSADITPLVAMSVGLLCGSMLGAVTGFGIGLLVDMVLVQTLGVTSLLYIVIGYWSGRLRELRDPAHGLVPLALGAAVTAFTGLGMAVIQFLLGVDAPVSLLLVQQIFITVLVNTLIALPVYAIVARIIRPVLPEDPRRRRRRAYTTGGLSPLRRPSERLGPDAALRVPMIQLPDDRRPPLTPQLALRVAIVGSIALVMFAIVFFRLWYLQVLSGDKYVAQAQTNRVRDISIPAPRGQIVDRNGDVLVDSVPTIAVQVTPTDLPKRPAALNRLYLRLAGVLGASTRPSRCPVDGHGIEHLADIPCLVAQQQAQLPYANVTLKTDVPSDVLYYLSERQNLFPGVNVEQVWLRKYPLGDVAAQLFGTVGRITKPEVHQSRYRGVSPNDVVGQSGIEWYYDRFLRGIDGADKVQVDSLGHARGDLAKQNPIAGHTLKLSLDLGLQKAGQQALQQAIGANPPATAGAFVALDPRDGNVLAMGSSPTFDPNVLTHPISVKAYNQLFGPGTGYPQLNRAIGSAYPTGSTFKGITATAALQSGAWSLGESYDDTGVYQNGPGDVRHNAGHAAYGSVDIVNAIRVSSDDFFYNLGRLMNVDVPKGGPLQQWARGYGIGRPTGIDIGGETTPAGILPSPAWRAARNRLELAYEHKHHKPCCTISDLRPWSVGDNENLAVGQGDLEATPLQLGVAYSTIENGGTVVRPHVGLEVDAADGSVLQQINPPPARHVLIAAQNLDAIRQGLHDAASQPGGTSADVFSGWDQGRFPVYGKTGTAQRPPQADQSWYVCFVPDPQRPILVVVTVEQGGFGAAAAAPAARQILSQWFYGNRGKFVVGQSKTL